MAPLLLLDLRHLDAAGKPFSADLPVDWLTTALADCDLTPSSQDGFVSLRYSRTGTDLIIHGKVSANVRTSCVRCLEPIVLAVDADLSLLLVTKASANSRRPRAERETGRDPSLGNDFSSAEADFDTYEGEEVVLDPFVREAILLELPPFPLCSATCAGIEPGFSAAGGTPVDPRLAALLMSVTKRDHRA